MDFNAYVKGHIYWERAAFHEFYKGMSAPPDLPVGAWDELWEAGVRYAEARMKAEEMEGNICLVVDDDGGWDAMLWSDFLQSDIIHPRVGWLASNHGSTNERWFKSAITWMKGKNVTDDINLKSRETYSVSWSLLGQWFCIPADATDKEKAAAVRRAKESLSKWFTTCPDEWIEDRFFGGFHCPEPGRRHVYFSTGDYSYTQAESGVFWANDAAHRRNRWERLLDENESWECIGPWTQDAPDDRG